MADQEPLVNPDDPNPDDLALGIPPARPVNKPQLVSNFRAGALDGASTGKLDEDQ